VEHAALSYQILVQAEGNVKVLATIMPGPVLAEYEAAVREAGYEPGVVLPSSLASLAVMDSLEPVLAANLSGQALTTSITSGQDLHLFRTVDLPDDREARAAEIQRSIAVAAAYYEDKLAGRPSQLRYAGVEKADDFARILGDPNLAVVDIVPSTGLGATTALGPMSIAGISGALAGA
jgi:type IV pilus assembly protein PilM